MTAIFVPQGNVTLSQAATICGVDHFNWLQFIKTVPNHWIMTSGGNVINPPLLDPINTSDSSQFYTVTSPRAPGIPAMTFTPSSGDASFDNQVYYWNEPTERMTYESNRGFLFTDTPKFYQEYLPDPQDAVCFDTMLVGVMADGSHAQPWSGIGTNLTWKSSTKCDAQFHTVGGNTTFVGYFKLVDEAGTPNVTSGNVFDTAVDMPYTITAGVNSATRGSISGAGTYIGGSTATLAATGSSGFAFTNWTDSGVVASTSPSYSFFVSGPRSLTANFQPNSWSSWTASNFTTGQLADITISGDSATPARDGVANLLKYALGMDPNISSRAGLPLGSVSTVSGIKYLTLTYMKNRAASDITFHPEWSGDLSTWSNVGVTEQVLSDDGARRQMQAAVPLEASPKLFIRLRVTRP